VTTQSLDRAKARELTSNPTLWVQFKCLIAWQIAEGILEPGDEVSIVRESEDFGISQVPAQKAFRALVAEALLLAPQSKGKPYMVAVPPKPQKWVHPAWRTVASHG
jgi:DNA-binding GntR family transcriptional regulator